MGKESWIRSRNFFLWEIKYEWRIIREEDWQGVQLEWGDVEREERRGQKKGVIIQTPSISLHNNIVEVFLGLFLFLTLQKKRFFLQSIEGARGRDREDQKQVIFFLRSLRSHSDLSFPMLQTYFDRKREIFAFCPNCLLLRGDRS